MSISELLVLYYCARSIVELELLNTHHNYCLKIILVVRTIFTHCCFKHAYRVLLGIVITSFSWPTTQTSIAFVYNYCVWS